ICVLFFFSSRRRHTRSKRDWSSDVCSSDLDDPLQPETKPENDNEILNELQELKKKFEKQEQFNEALLQKLEEQNQYINESINKRDHQLLDTMNEIQHAKIEASAAEEKKKGFWSRLFSKNK